MTDMIDLGRTSLNRVALQRNIMLGCWEMFAGYRGHTHSVTHCLKGEVESIHDGEVANVILFDNAAVQKMMDDLWHGGVRPSTGVSSTGQVEALNGEITHLRALVTRIINTEWEGDGVIT